MADGDGGGFQKLVPNNGRVEAVYDLGADLGKGAFSVVKQGKHRITGEKAAIKIIPNFRFRDNPRAQAAILAEIEAMRRIREKSQNPCLISMLGVYRDPSKVCIVMEQLEGGEVFDRIVARGHYTERDASQVLRKLALALKDCHSMGILHRDVKPENILYVSKADDAEIKLTDFGLAMLDSGPSVSRRDDNLVGTPGYVAPEVLKHREYGPPCDVWACGVIAYILLVGYPPFFPAGDDTLFEVIKKGQYFFHPDAWDSISGEAKDLVHKILMVDTTKRATMDSIINHPWVTQQHGLPDQHLSDTIQRLEDFNAKRKWRAVATVVMLGARLGLKKRNRSEGEQNRDTNYGLSDLELKTLKTAFDASSKGGVLSRMQLAAVLSDIGFGPVPSDRLFDLFDADGNGEVDYAEFLTGISSFRSSEDKALRFCFDVYDRDGVGAINLEQLKAVLSCVMVTQDDSDGSSSPRPTQPSIPLAKDSFLSSPVRVPSISEGGASKSDGGACDGSRISSRLPDGTVDEGSDRERRLSEIFSALDVDGNGTIDFEEFKAGVKREPLLVQAFLAPVQQGSLGTAPIPRQGSSSIRSSTENARRNSKGDKSGVEIRTHVGTGCADDGGGNVEEKSGTQDAKHATDGGKVDMGR